ncbi:uncharacterized protein LOC129770727 [Toxorhynchites rutilus septentrionalis]|uniref:uncharacterized protein LOC129770727 n=1 Tax=Toxorhynchites rutilus septentrionalis TaxID=329112 RepID=UPI002478E2C1|nr:uncharacterized protein LOC129770727 [Toxorhynchites rutilus septentrionalis]
MEVNVEIAARNCIMCDRPDSEDNLVQRDRCDHYVHFGCAGVNDSIPRPDRSFPCKYCVERDEKISIPTKRSSQGTRRSRRSAQLALYLKRLEEENRIRMKKIDEEEKFRKMRLEAEEDMMKKKFELLQADLGSDDDRSSSTSGVSPHDVRENTEKWVNLEGQNEGANSIAATSSRHPQQSFVDRDGATASGYDNASTPKNAAAETILLSEKTVSIKNCVSFRSVLPSGLDQLNTYSISPIESMKILPSSLQGAASTTKPTQTPALKVMTSSSASKLTTSIDANKSLTITNQMLHTTPVLSAATNNKCSFMSSAAAVNPPYQLTSSHISSIEQLQPRLESSCCHPTYNPLPSVQPSWA